ncbi:hypothetical protein BGW41_002416 [Actinomortierella wolfii]|nr:hypothetical protein BGW41_002416 [Actinomortierella wolfii]
MNQDLPGHRPARVGSLLLQSVSVTIPTFTADLDLGSIANPSKYSTIKQYLFASLLLKPVFSLLLDSFTLSFLSAWIKNSLGKVNSASLVIYALATAGSLAIVSYGAWSAFQVLKKGHIQPIFVNREAYRWTCLTHRDRFLFFERCGQGYGIVDAVIFFTWFTLQDWMQHLLCDLPRLIINCSVLASVAHQKSLVSKGETPTFNFPELTAITHLAIALNIILHVCNLVQFFGCVAVLVLVRMGKLIGLRKDEQLHTYCQRNLNVRIVRLYKLARNHGAKDPLREHNQLEQQQAEYANLDPESLAALAWDTETQDESINYDHYAYRPRPISHGPPARKMSQPAVDNEPGASLQQTGTSIEMTESHQQQHPFSSAHGSQGPITAAPTSGGAFHTPSPYDPPIGYPYQVSSTPQFQGSHPAPILGSQQAQVPHHNSQYEMEAVPRPLPPPKD